MIVERVTVRGWRGYRDEHVFDFDQGLNVLVGPNEAGKSTLFEALQRGFFDRHSGKSQELKGIRPLGSSLDPEVELVLRVAGERLKVHKRFLGSATAKVWVERGGAWELDDEGDEADRRVRELLEGDRPHGATDHRHRGLAQALWCLQREGGIPDEDWSEAVRGGLEGLVEMVASVPGEEEALAAIRARYAEDWTPTGRLSAASPLQALDAEMEDLRDDLAARQARLDQARELRGRLETHQVTVEEQRDALARARERRAELDEGLETAQGLEDDLRTARDAVRSLDDQLERLRRDRARLEEADRELERLEEERARLETAHRAASAAHEEDRAKRAALQETVAGLEERRKELGARRKRLTARVEAAELRAKQARVAQELTKAREAGEALAAAREERDAVSAPTDEELEEVEARARERDVLQARIQGAAVRLEFDLAGDPAIEADPGTERDGDAWLVTRATTFRLGDLGTVRVRSGGGDLADLIAERDALDERIHATRVRFEAGSLEELRERASRRAELERRVERLAERVEELEDPEALRAEAERLEGELRVALERAGEEGAGDERAGDEGEDGGASTATDSTDPAASRREAARVEAELEEVDETLTTRRAELDGLELEERTREVTELASQVKHAAERMASLGREKVEVLKPYGTADHLVSLAEEKEAATEEARTRAQELEAEVERRVAEPRREREALTREIEALTQKTGSAESDRKHLLGQIEAIARDGVASEVADLEGRLEHLERRRAVLERRAEGAKVLKELVDALAAERAEALAGPVAEQVAGWMDRLTDGRYDRLALDTALKPTGLRAAAYGEELEVEHLSHGTREQLAVLLRLAIAVLVSREERQLVVLDDRLVDSDPVRLRRLRAILEEVAGTCQVLLATCSETAYQGVEGRVVRVPEGGRRGG